MIPSDKIMEIQILAQEQVRQEMHKIIDQIFDSPQKFYLSEPVAKPVDFRQSIPLKTTEPIPLETNKLEPIESVKPIKFGYKLDNQELFIKRAYEGIIEEELAKEFNVTVPTIIEWRKHFNIPSLNEIRHKQRMDLHNQGLTFKQIANKLNMSFSTIVQWGKKNGLISNVEAKHTFIELREAKHTFIELRDILRSKVKMTKGCWYNELNENPYIFKSQAIDAAMKLLTSLHYGSQRRVQYLGSEWKYLITEVYDKESDSIEADSIEAANLEEEIEQIKEAILNWLNQYPKGKTCEEICEFCHADKSDRGEVTKYIKQLVYDDSITSIVGGIFIINRPDYVELALKKVNLK